MESDNLTNPGKIDFFLHKVFMYKTSGAGSRASAEQFVGSYDLVEFTLVLVGDTIRKSAITPFKNGPRAHKRK